MSHTSRTGLLIGVAAAAGAFVAAALLSSAGIPTARADDFTDIVTTADAELAHGQQFFDLATTDFGSADVPDGVAALVSGLDNDLIAVPDTLLIGTAEALTNEPLSDTFSFSLDFPSSFAQGLAAAENAFTLGESYLSAVAPDLGAGEYGYAFGNELLGTQETTIIPAEFLFLGGLASLGL
jgi:hypothetical protein